MSCGSTLMSHNGNNFMQGGPLPSQPQNAPQHLPGGVGNGAVNMDGTVASGSCASQGRGSIFAQVKCSIDVCPELWFFYCLMNHVTLIRVVEIIRTSREERRQL